MMCRQKQSAGATKCACCGCVVVLKRKLSTKALKNAIAHGEFAIGKSKQKEERAFAKEENSATFSKI